MLSTEDYLNYLCHLRLQKIAFSFGDLFLKELDNINATKFPWTTFWQMLPQLLSFSGFKFSRIFQNLLQISENVNFYQISKQAQPVTISVCSILRNQCNFDKVSQKYKFINLIKLQLWNKYDKTFWWFCHKIVKKFALLQ